MLLAVASRSVKHCLGFHCDLTEKHAITYVSSIPLGYVQLRMAEKSLENEFNPKTSKASSSSDPATLVLDSLPYGTDDGQTQPLHSEEMDHLAKEFGALNRGASKVFVPEAPTVT